MQQATSRRDIDTLIHAGWLLPMASAGEVLRDHAIAIDKQRIIELLPSAEASQRYAPQREFDLRRHALLPGLINAHGHAPMTLFRGFADDMALQPWLEERIWPAESRWVSEAFVYDGARLAIAEMLLAGITCFCDMYFFPEQVARAAQEASIRAMLAAPVLDFPTVWGQNAREYIQKTTQLHDDYKTSELIHLAFGPHAAYTVSDEPLQRISVLAEELDIPIHIHLHENAREIEDAMRETGVRPLQRLANLGLLSPKLQTVHMTQLEEAEIALLADHGVHVIHCPASNLKLASGQCPVAELLKAGVNVGLGSDGAASNNDLDLFNEMRLAALLGKAVAADPAAVNAWQALHMATLGGARALGLDDRIGSLEAGKFADLIAVDLAQSNTAPVFEPASTLVYSTSSYQVSHVWVGGQLSMEDRKIRGLDPDALVARAQEWAGRIQGG